MCILFWKKAKAIWNRSADYQTKEIYLLSGLQNFLKEFNRENGSADLQTTWIICSKAFETNKGILRLIIFFSKKAKEI